MDEHNWIAVDLDGTLAVYKGWNGGKIGHPIPRMVLFVQELLRKGIKVKIFTARVAASGMVGPSGELDSKEFADKQRALIEDWCEAHIGRKLEVTAVKDLYMVEGYDDRFFRVEHNTGRVAGWQGQ